MPSVDPLPPVLPSAPTLQSTPPAVKSFTFRRLQVVVYDEDNKKAIALFNDIMHDGWLRDFVEMELGNYPIAVGLFARRLSCKHIGIIQLKSEVKMLL